jgi:archaellum component FlaC
MSDEPDNLVVVYLRRLDTKMDDLAADMVEVKERLGPLEAQYSSISRRTDRVSGDVEQIRRWLDIVPVA